MEIKNKNVFVTGSTRGIGKAIALQFAKAGSNLIINGRSAISEELLAEFTAYGVKAVGISGDISKSEDAKQMVAEAIETLGSVDILVNNAGITRDGLSLKMSEEDFESVLMGNAGQANYAASKAGLIGLTKSIAREVAARNVRVNAVAPGFIESDMTEVLSDKVKDAMKGQIPMKRFGMPEEIATATQFLAEQEYMTGQVLTIDGGVSM